MNKRTVGNQYEHIAARYLTEHNVSIIEKNYRNRYGEIDLIAEDGEYLCFVEVKYRTSSKYGYPLEAIDYRKRETIKKVALSYLSNNKYKQETPVRFDCIGILDDEITWIKDAFR